MLGIKSFCQKYNQILLATIPLAFYLFFAIWDGVIICIDSPSYIEMSLSREPFYPTFLAINRAMFGWLGQAQNGIDIYLFVVVFIQSILASAATYSLVRYLKEEYDMGMVLSLFIILICLSVSLLCRFAAKRSSMYSNCIMTEGICLALFLLFARCLISYLNSHSKKSLIIASVLSFIMISSRKQMYITLILLVLAVIYVEWFRLKNVKNGALILLTALLLIIGCNKVFENGYSIFVRGETASHFNDNRFLATMIFYTSESEDASRIEDSEIRTLFEDIYNTCESEGSMLHSAGKNINDIVVHFGDHYDMIQIDHMWPMIEEFSASKIGDLSEYESITSYEVAREKYTDEITHKITVALLPVTFTKIVKVFFCNCYNGLVNTVAKNVAILRIYAIFAATIYLILLFWGLRKNGLTKTNVLAIFVLLAIALNIAVVSMVIFCQTRYMIYNMPLFYIGLVLMLKELMGLNKASKGEQVYQ